MKIYKFWNRYKASILCCCALVVVLSLNNNEALASAVGFKGNTVSGITWPWTRIFNSIAYELSGPLPMVLGIIAIAAAAISLFYGNCGAGTQKFFAIIFAVGICLTAPRLIGYISSSADGATILQIITP